MDVLLVPVGGETTLVPSEAAEVVAQIGPKIVIPMHFSVDVHARDPMGGDARLCTHCVIVFVALDDAEGKPVPVPPWVPQSDDDRRLCEYATQVMALSKGIEQTVARYRAPA